jgi:hypothetical protein
MKRGAVCLVERGLESHSILSIGRNQQQFDWRVSGVHLVIHSLTMGVGGLSKRIN